MVVPEKSCHLSFSIDDVNVDEAARLEVVDADWSDDATIEISSEIPEYFRIKVPTKDEYMTIATIYNGVEDEHIERNEFTVRWLTDKGGTPYKFESKEEARVFLALNVDPKFIRPTDRPQSIEAYAVQHG